MLMVTSCFAESLQRQPRSCPTALRKHGHSRASPTNPPQMEAAPAPTERLQRVNGGILRSWSKE